MGCKIYSKEKATQVPWVSTFNIPLLESIASGHFFDRTFTPVNEAPAQGHTPSAERVPDLLPEHESDQDAPAMADKD